MSTNASQGVGSDSVMDDEALRMISYLTAKYTRGELMGMFRSVARSQRSSRISTSTISSDSIATSWEGSTVSSVHSADPSFSIGSSQSSQGSLWPVTDGQYLNNLPMSHDLPLTLPAVRLHPSSPVPVLGKAYACPFCAELGIHAGAKRINDLKRHLRNFHNTNAEWFCRVPWCEIVFDWQAAYETHLKEAHNQGGF